MKHIRIVLGMVFILFGVKCFSNTPLKLVAYVSANNCTACVGFSKSLKRYPAILHHTYFSFSNKEVTYEQADGFLSDLFEENLNITFDPEIYRSLNGRFGSSRFPHIAVFDTITKEIVFSVSVDSLSSYIDLLKGVVDLQRKYKVEQVKSPRISRLIGWKNLAYANNKAFVYGFQSAPKIYMYDFKQHTTDSIFVTDETLQKLFVQVGIKDKVSDVRKFIKDNDIPVPLYDFGSPPYIRDSLLSTYFSIMYYDPNYTGDTLKGKWYSFIAAYNIYTKALQFIPIESWTKNYEKNFAQNDLPVYYPDHDLAWSMPDGRWIGSCNKLERAADTTDKTKLFIMYKYNEKEQRLDFERIFDSVYFKNIRTYKGNTLNDYHTHNTFTLSPPYAFFSESNQLYDMENHKQISLKDQLADFNWISDIEVTPNTITVLGLETGLNLQTVLIDRRTYQVIGKRQVAMLELSSTMNSIELANGENKSVELGIMSFMILDQGQVVYINRQGEVIRLFPE